MTDLDTDLSVGGPSRLSSALLNAAGVLVVGFFLVRQGLLAEQLWVVILTAIAMLGWLARALLSIPLRSGRAALVAALVGVVAGSVVALPTDVLAYIPSVVCLAAVISTPRTPLPVGIGLAVVSLVIVAVTVILHPQVSPNALLGAASGLVIASLVGLSRRQSRTASVRERELLRERARLGDERARTAALAERSRIAGDIHDVLAHSLGGLVLQLDAVDALLESGKTADAHARVTAARALAAEGLEEARKAVDALRDPESADPAVPIEQLVATHRSLGAAAELTVDGEAGQLPGETVGVLRRAAQEVLSNARRHAPGEPTELALHWAPDAVAFTASTPVAAGTPVSSPGGGRGLLGLRERVEALGGRADWVVRDGAFEVTAEVPR